MKFAIDIGTRKVAGLLGEMTGGKIRIIDAVVLEHEKRAMLDGQIHSVEGVTKIVSKIKSLLEERNGVKLSKVTTALAGRSLHTEECSAEKNFKGDITGDELTLIELEAVRGASQKASEKGKHNYYCAGYSAVYYEVDGGKIKDPLQYYAKEKIAVKVIATFLPNQVFESMMSVLKNCGLEIELLTLEPIAALSVTIPEDMRILNVALVDVGAGTSDIAITEKNQIKAFGMIAKAGDEITEEICGKYLVDFREGERIKRSIGKEQDIEAPDIFNNPVKIGHTDLISAIDERVSEIAASISDEILSLNGKQPQAVVMAGGGSSLEHLRIKIAEKIGLPPGRVGIRLPHAENLPAELSGTDGITPLGILNAALTGKGIGFIEVMLNREKNYIINLAAEIKVIDVLASAGTDMKKLYGKPGSALTFTLNGVMKILRGAKAEHSRIFINNEEAGLYAVVKSGDAVEFTPAKDGEAAAGVIKQVIPEDYYMTIELNGKRLDILPVIDVNGREVTDSEFLEDRAVVTVRKVEQAGEVLLKNGYTPQSSEERDIVVTLNGEPKVLKQRNYSLKVNGAEVSSVYTVKNMDRVEYSDRPAFYRIRDLTGAVAGKKVSIYVNGKPFEVETEAAEIYMNGKKAGSDEFIINGASIEVKLKEQQLLLSSIFKTYPFDLEKAKGKMLELKVNGEKAGYTTPIGEGAKVEIGFV